MRETNSDLSHKVERLYQLTVYVRWAFIIFSWLTVGAYGVWGLRAEIALWLDYFTWSAVYYGLHFNLVSTICLAYCIGLTVSVLVWQSRNIIWGLPAKERQQLERQVKKILHRGVKHPLWKWINS